MANQVPQMRPKVVTTRVVEIDGQRQTVRTCNEPGCARTHLAQGLCATCYQRVRYQVDPAVAERKREQMRRWRAGSSSRKTVSWKPSSFTRAGPAGSSTAPGTAKGRSPPLRYPDRVGGRAPDNDKPAPPRHARRAVRVRSQLTYELDGQSQ